VFKAEDNKTFEFEGKTYTRQKGVEMQGKLESAMVRQKELANMAKAAGDDDLRREAQGNINLLASKYNDFCKASGLPTRAERMNVSGFKAVKAESTSEGRAKYKSIVNRKSDEEQYKKYIGIIGAENMPKTIDEFQKMKYTDIDKWDDIKSRVRTKNYLQEQLSYIWYGEKCFIPTNTRFVTVVTIAGPGTEDPVKILDYLMKTYGGTTEDWTKKAGQVKSKKYIFDVHWFEKDGIQYETKLKYRKERKI